MRFWTDDDSLTAGADLEEGEPDLSAEAGEKILDALCDGMARCFERATSPGGVPWKKLKAATVQRKNSEAIGVETGAMRAQIPAGDRQLERRRVTWSYPGNSHFGKAHGFHNGNPKNRQPGRRFVGWTQGAQAIARAATGGGDL